MADANVSTVLEQLAAFTVGEIQYGVGLIVGAGKAVENITNTLKTIQALLRDAENRQVREETIRIWLDKLKETSYHMVDVLDEWNTSMQKLLLEGVENAPTFKKKVCFFFLSPCFYFRQVGLRFKIALKIIDINEKLDAIAKEKTRYNFKMMDVVELRRVKSTSFVNMSEICGRDDEKNTLVNHLISKSSEGQTNLQIISIVGMGGIGKTTLAQFAYNSDEVKENFGIRVWVYVSDLFDEFKVAKAILEAITGSASQLGNLQPILTYISDIIAQQKFLLVLDDMWTEDYDKWEPLYNCLNNGLGGSKILVTTRKTGVAFMMKSVVFSVEQLSENDCWELFARFAFIDRSEDECKELEKVGRKIVGKCKGLPLAARTMGSFLRFKKTRKEWETILDSELWELEEFERSISPTLFLSYNDLPPMVKKCFSYCAIFPKNHSLNKEDLIKLWMAQDYLGLERNTNMEMIGEEYFNILASRSFFQEFNIDDDGILVGCKMHDIVHDFAQYVTKNEFFTMRVKDFEEANIKVHHLMLMVNARNLFPISIVNAKKLRSLLIEFEAVDSIVNQLLRKLCGRLTCLRILRLSCCLSYDGESTFSIPKEIGKLMHLRYLDLSGNSRLEMLPETLCELYNLQTLKLQNCWNLKKLPQRMEKLINLRHLINDGTNELSYMPKGIKRLTCLRTLSEFSVSAGDCGGKACSLHCLSNFHHLQGSLLIKGLGNLVDAREAEKVEVGNKEHILDLKLDFSGFYLRNNETVLEALQPSPNLQGLTISVYAGNTVLPSWIKSLSNLRKLYLNDCFNCEHFPPLGKLPSLESLVIANMRKVKRVSNEFLGIESNDTSSVVYFPKLKSLEFRLVEEWEEWDFGSKRMEFKDQFTILPCLRSLEIRVCKKLKSLPKQLLQKATLENLIVYRCPILAVRYERDIGKNWLDISHIPNIWFYS